MRAVFMGGVYRSYSKYSNLAKPRARLALDASEVAADGVALSLVVVLVLVLVLVPGLCGPGRVPAARGRAVALRVEPPGYRCLAP